MTGIDLVKAAVRALDEKKAEDIEVIQITELSVVADYFVIANVQYTCARSCERGRGCAF